MMLSEQKGTHMQKKKISNYNLTSYKNINSKQITDRKVKCKTINFLEENIKEHFYGIGLGKHFLDTTPRAQATKEESNKLEFHQIKNFCSTKDIAKRMRKQAAD